MPKIKPFKGIRPNPDYADEVVLDIENLSLSEAKVIRQENPYSYVNMLVPKLDNLFLLGSKTELAFKKINENFEEFLERGILKKDLSPAIYLYSVSRDQLVQTGIWTVTSVDDYLNNNIRKHELTRPERENALIDYLQQTGIDANPVLLAYRDIPEINTIVGETCRQEPDLSFTKDGAKHRLWKIDDEPTLKLLIRHFEEIPCGYIADGHHRAAAAALLALQYRKIDPSYTGEEEYNFFTSVYMPANQLRILEFNRLIKGLNGYSAQDLVDELEKSYTVEVQADSVSPTELHQFGMYLQGNWYKLLLKGNIIMNSDPVSQLDVSILQDSVLSTLLGVADPRTDPRVSFAGGNQKIAELVAKVDSGEFHVLFTLYPTSFEEIIRVADEGKVMPPKSTWFEPKFQAGLLIHKIS